MKRSSDALSLRHKLAFYTLTILLAYAAVEAFSLVAYSVLSERSFWIATLQVERARVIQAPWESGTDDWQTASLRAQGQVIHLYSPDQNRPGQPAYGFPAAKILRCSIPAKATRNKDQRPSIQPPDRRQRLRIGRSHSVSNSQALGSRSISPLSVTVMRYSGV